MSAYEKNINSKSPRRNSSVFLAIGVLIFVCLVAYVLLSDVLDERRKSAESAELENLWSNYFSASKEFEKLPSLSFSSQAQQKSSNKTSVSVSESKPSAYFSLGDNSEKVKSVMGVPDQIFPSEIIGDTWYYGSSTVDFDTTGKVEGWMFGNTTLSVYMGDKIAGNNFSLGDNKATVIKAMGTPDGVFPSDIIGDTWYYGSSTVDFDTLGRVEGWMAGNRALSVFLGSKRDGYTFSLGDDKSTVLLAMGTPDGVFPSEIIGDTWYYGSSTVDFDTSGKVEGWTKGNVSLNIR